MKQLVSLNPAQKQAVEYLDGPLLIVAGAGTGKTKVITEKIAYLIESGKAKPEEILALTFTDKAAEEMRERVDDMLTTGYSDLHISTFHGFCQRMLEQYALHIGLSNSFKLLTDIDGWLLVKQHLDNLPLNYFRPLGNPHKHIHELLQHFSKCKDELIDPQAYVDYAEGLAHDGDAADQEEKDRMVELSRVYHAYNQLLIDNKYLDFGDLIFHTVMLLQKRPSIKRVIARRYKYILVDEFQDVNWAQYVLVKELAEKSQLTVVGDDDQSIYAFRGSNVSLILRFKEDFPGSKEIVLNENYRSRQEILDIAYASIQHNNPNRLEASLKIDKRLRAAGEFAENGPVVLHKHYHTLEDEVKGIVAEIMQIAKEKSDVSLDDIAVLVRANNHAEPLLAAFDSVGIPYQFLASSGLYRQPIILDCFNFLLLVNNCYESGALHRMLCLPMLGIRPEDAHTFMSTAEFKSVPYFDALSRAREFQLSESGVAQIEKLQGYITKGIANAQKEKTSLVLYHFLEESGYLLYLTQQEEAGNQDVIQSIYHLKQFFDCIEAYEQTVPEARVSQFVAYYRALIEAGDEGALSQVDDTPNSINVLTVHASKGLEFKYVFIMNLVEERFPTRRRSDSLSVPTPLVHERQDESEAHYEEERRLFYVAVTRAKDRIYMTSADDYGGVRKKKLSRFLAELGFGTDGKSPVPAGINFSMEKQIASTPLQQYALPKAFSYSQIKSYQTCPYQYKLQHILKIPTKGSASMSFGTSMHSTLQKFYLRVRELNSMQQDSLFGSQPETPNVQSNIKVPPLEELLKLYDGSWIPDWYKDKKQREEYYAKGKEILCTFYASHAGNWTIPVNLESWFKIKVGDYFLHGRIDRVDQLADGGLEIIDYKTGATKEKLTSEDKEQLLIYQIAAEALPEYRNVGHTAKLTFYYLNDNVRTSFIGENKDLEKLRTSIAKSLDGIKAGDFRATPNQFACNYCNFKEMCEYRAG